MSKRSFKVVGHSVPKLDAMALALGGPLFCADNLPRGCLFARVLRSPHAHARILSIDTSEILITPSSVAIKYLISEIQLFTMILPVYYSGENKQ